MLKDFSVDTRTQFINRQGERIARGNHKAPFYAYIMDGDTQWLVVSWGMVVHFKGALHQLQPRGEGSLKGEDSFYTPGTYALLYKRRVK